VTPATQARLGRMLGVNYLAIVRVEAFSANSEPRVGLASFLSSAPTYVTKVNVGVRLNFVDVKSGEIVQSVEDSRDATSPISQPYVSTMGEAS